VRKQNECVFIASRSMFCGGCHQDRAWLEQSHAGARFPICTSCIETWAKRVVFLCDAGKTNSIFAKPVQGQCDLQLETNLWLFERH
jgi:hypothetical protein